MSPLQKDIRTLLKQMPSGATNIELSKLLNKPTNIVRASCIRMPDVYVGRWIEHKRTQAEMVWMIADIPKDAPKPRARPYIKLKNAKRDNLVPPENKHDGRSRAEDRFINPNGVKTKWVIVQPWQH